MSGQDDFEQITGIHFNDSSLLRHAFTHKSYLNENTTTDAHDNERMEFLGDALLNFVMAERLYTDFPDFPEGKLTEIRISLVRQEKLAEKASSLSLGEYMLLGKGEELTGGRKRLSNLANTFESLVAAIYLDQGMETVHTFILDNFKNELASFKGGYRAANYKALLQELTQTEYKCLPKYQVVEATGPDHNRLFYVSVVVEEMAVAIGSGKSKKMAEFEAARLAYTKLTTWDK